MVGGFVYDTGFSGSYTWTGSTADAIDTSGVSNPAPQAVYQTLPVRVDWYPFSYTLGNLTPGASYTVRLHFAEPFVQQGGTAAVQRGHQRHAGADELRHLADGGGQGQGGGARRSRPRPTPTGRSRSTSAGGRRTPLVNGIEVLSGSTVVQAINCGLLAGGTITINPGTFTNQGSLQASDGGSVERQRAERAPGHGERCRRAATA